MAYFHPASQAWREPRSQAWSLNIEADILWLTVFINSVIHWVIYGQHCHLNGKLIINEQIKTKVNGDDLKNIQDCHEL